VDAVTMNVAVVRPDAPGCVTVYPCAEGRPTASNLNCEAGQTVRTGVLLLFGRHRLIADVAGGFSSDPRRRVDDGDRVDAGSAAP
jgi:hypothetical protein